MECKSCGAIWKPPTTINNRIENCPFCGEKLMTEAPKLDTMTAVLTYMASEFGDDVLKSESKLLGTFSDLAPQLKRERIMLRHFVECKGNAVLLNACKKDEATAKTQIEIIIRRMEEDLMVAHGVAKYVCSCFWIAIGGVESAMNSETPLAQPTTRLSPRKNENEPTDPILKNVKPTMETGPLVKKEEESWRKSEAAHREWIQSQSASQNNKSVSGSASLVNVSEQRRMQLAHEHWSKPQQSHSPKDARLSTADMEDWKKSEAAHRQWLKSLGKF